MKKATLFITLILILSVASTALAKGKSENETVKITSPVKETNQVQIKTQNQGQETQVQTSYQKENQEKESTKSAAPRSQQALEHRSIVAAKVEELLTTQAAKGGIGSQISEFAQSQKKDEEEIVSTVEKLESRPKLVKNLFGPDFQQVKALEQIQERNRQRIQQLEQLKTKVANAGDLSKIREIVATLEQENNFLADQISLEKNSRSLFGWLLKLFSK